MNRAALRAVAVVTVVTATSVTGPAAWAAVDTDSVITTFAGTHVEGFSGDGGPATAAELDEPRDTAVGPNGDLYVCDTFNNRVRVIHSDGTIDTFAGDGSHTLPTDPDLGDGGPAVQAHLNWPHDVFVDATGDVYIADSNHNRVREVTPDGIIHTVIGTGQAGHGGDGGLATSATLKNPKSVFVQGGYLYTADLSNEVRRVDLSTGIISRYAGTGAAAYSGDGGPALKATLNQPQRLQVDAAGNVYVADTLNHAIRRIDAGSGIITTIAGTGVAGFNGDSGVATQVQLYQPRGIALDGVGTLYVADSNNQRVRQVDLSTGTMHTIAGTGNKGYSGDGGPAIQAKLDQPRGLTVAPNGDLIIADTFNNTLRRVSATETGGGGGGGGGGGTELLPNNSVEDTTLAGRPYLGKYSSNDAVAWSTDVAEDGSHSIKVTNPATTASDAGLANATISSTAVGGTYLASAWVRGAAGQRATLRLTEAGHTASVATLTLPDDQWHQLTRAYVSQSGGALKYAVAIKALPAAASFYADEFSVAVQ